MNLVPKKVDATMLTPNPVQPYTNYIITLYDPAGNVIPDNLLTKAHIDKELPINLGISALPIHVGS
ncbi:MAG: hypothetical protein IPJ39_13395 [Saprospiraceae bacterium]|nr:hypothetical protein [Saprospiraceae bacterium]